jgi:hypothetical protein
MKRSTWSLVLLGAVVLGCGDEDRSGDPFGQGLSGDGGAGGFVSGGGAAGGNPSGGIYGGTLAGGGQCLSKTVSSGRVSPDILIVLDRSLSMKMQGVNRWDPSVAGIKAITSMLADRVKFGLMTFPGQNAPAGSMDSCDPGVSRVPVGQGQAGAIAMALDQTQPGGRTPTAPTLKVARELIDTTRKVDPDSKASPQYVLLVTDGAPNCSMGGGGGGGSGGFGAGEPAAVDASVAEIEAMTKAGIRTFVLGYDTQNDGQLKMALDRMATAGGTGEKTHRPIEDQASLVAQFREITEVALTCEFVLEAPVSDPKYVKVQIDGKQLNFNAGDGWKLAGDMRTITLQGGACNKVKEVGHVINVSVECTEVGTVE